MAESNVAGVGREKGEPAVTVQHRAAVDRQVQRASESKAIAPNVPAGVIPETISKYLETASALEQSV